jgi:thiosulfate/3-mercaptopyruvate sulfurtransferase
VLPGDGPEALAVAADDGRKTEAGRVRFVLQYVSLPAAVLNGGAGVLDTLPPRAPDYAGRLVLVPGSRSRRPARSG